MSKGSEVDKKISKKSKKPLFIKGAYALIIVALIGFGTFYFIKYQNVNDKYKNITKSAEQKQQEVVAKVAKLYTIPRYEDEKPFVAEITDVKTQIADTPIAKKFFANAKNGDMILVWQKDDLSILFRPSENKIINTDNYANAFAAINTYKVGVIAPKDEQDKFISNLQLKFGNVQIVSKSEPKTSITTGVVVDVDGKDPESAKKLADALGYTVGNLPEGETKPVDVKFIIVAPSAVAQ